MSWMVEQRSPSDRLQMTPNQDECLIDLPDGCAALQRCFDRLEQWAKWLVMKFNKSCTWGGIIRTPLQAGGWPAGKQLSILVHPMLTIS